MRGDWDAAFSGLRDIHEFARLVVESEGPLIDYLVGIACEMVALQEMERMLQHPDLPPALLPKFQMPLESNPNHDGAYRTALKSEYLVFRNLCEEFARGDYDPASIQAMMPGVDDGEPESPMRRYAAQLVTCLLFQPNRTKQLYLDTLGYHVRRGDLPRPAREQLAQPPVVRLLHHQKWHYLVSTNGLGRIIVMHSVGTYGSLEDRRDLIRCYRGALRMLWALRTWEIAEGELPESIQDLVPLPLRALPLDAFSAKPFLYSAEKRRLWSVGPDGKDEGGQENPEHFTDPRHRSEPTLELRWTEPAS
jgi:hypothetical protein